MPAVTLPAAPATPSAASARPVRVVIVDDSVVARGLLSRWVGAVPGFEVAGTAKDGRGALDVVRGTAPDIVLLDLDMPELDGVETLPLLLRERPDLSVIVVSTLSRRNAEISLRCLSLGAVDTLAKPCCARELSLANGFRDELAAKLGSIAVRHRAGPACPKGRRERLPAPAPDLLARPRAIVVGASTGGPRALGYLLRDLAAAGPNLPPVLIVQHLPPIFTAALARQLATETGIPTREARHGEPVEAGHAYLAPGGRHMGLESASDAVAIRLDDGPPLRHCRPAVDILFGDAAAVYRGGALAIVLTGMGCDGLEGARAIKASGGTVLAQNEDSSVVWGMPGSVARAGLARAILPLAEIGPAIRARIAAGPGLDPLAAHGERSP